MSTSIGVNAVAPINIFREYIGAKDNVHRFPKEIINPDIDEFHFILASAKEDYDEKGKGLGTFKRSWNYNDFGPDVIRNLKHEFEEKKRKGEVKVVVRVIISIGGPGSTFNPAEKNTWPDRAIDSLKSIVHDYNHYCTCKIDGIDFNFEKIETDPDLFSWSIGKVIKGLKEDYVKEESRNAIISIAPSQSLRPHYKRLYQEYGPNIDWVDYQFSHQPISPPSEFPILYNHLLNEYNYPQDQKLLAGFSTDPSEAGKDKISRDDFISGCKELFINASLPGIFVWDANDSAFPPNDEPPYVLELKAQKILIGTDTTV